MNSRGATPHIHIKSGMLKLRRSYGLYQTLTWSIPKAWKGSNSQVGCLRSDQPMELKVRFQVYGS